MPPCTSVELHLFGDSAEVEETAAILRQALNVLEELPNFQDPDLQEDESNRVRRRLIIQELQEADG